jgi:hypothetical protein
VELCRHLVDKLDVLGRGEVGVSITESSASLGVHELSEDEAAEAFNAIALRCLHMTGPDFLRA